MHVVARPRDEAITIKIGDGRIYRVTIRNGEAHVPDHVGKYLIEKGYVALGSAPNPKPQWATTGNGHGELLDMWEPWCKEILSKEKTE
jgi:hypothetical protein